MDNSELPETVEKCIKKNSYIPSIEIRNTCLDVLDVILKNSELKELWLEGITNDVDETSNEWFLAVDMLRKKIEMISEI